MIDEIHFANLCDQFCTANTKALTSIGVSRAAEKRGHDDFRCPVWSLEEARVRVEVLKKQLL
ncbi:MAG: hypothetical protein JEZ06_18700 [Anaerolineaceae bacterium]|nr:hypothetical protein [Anaerolineaceae bacterium]